MNQKEYDHLKFELNAALGTGDWFTSQLMRLMMKADKGNFAKLAMMYPNEAAVVDEYKNNTPVLIEQEVNDGGV